MGILVGSAARSLSSKAPRICMAISRLDETSPCTGALILGGCRRAQGLSGTWHGWHWPSSRGAWPGELPWWEQRAKEVAWAVACGGEHRWKNRTREGCQEQGAMLW